MYQTPEAEKTLCMLAHSAIVTLAESEGSARFLSLCSEETVSGAGVGKFNTPYSNYVVFCLFNIAVSLSHLD